MSTSDHPETPTPTGELLARTLRRAAQLRRQRRAAAGALVTVVVALAVAVPLAVHDSPHTRVLRVVGGPTTLGLIPTSVAPPSTAAPPPTSAPASSSPTSTAVPTTGGAAPECATGQLAGSLANPGGAAGSVGYDLVLRNTGTAACSLTGYPGVSYVSTSAGTTVGAPAQRNPSGSGAPTVTLDPGRSARATLIEVDSLNYPADTCRLTSVGGLRVYPPDQTASLFVAQATRACANPATPVLQIGPFEAAPTAGG